MTAWIATARKMETSLTRWCSSLTSSFCQRPESPQIHDFAPQISSFIPQLSSTFRSIIVSRALLLWFAHIDNNKVASKTVFFSYHLWCLVSLFCVLELDFFNLVFPRHPAPVLSPALSRSCLILTELQTESTSLFLLDKDRSGKAKPRSFTVKSYKSRVQTAKTD